MAREPGPSPQQGEPLLTRLLRRRADEPAVPDQGAAAAGDVDAASVGDSDIREQSTASDASPQAPDAPPPSRVDPRSGRPIDELVDADLPSLDSIGPDSDVRAFLGRNISPELRRQALRKLFHQPKFNVVCLCAEYAENYNNFTPMGSIVPHDLKRQLGIQAERLAKRLLEQETAAENAAHADIEAADPGAQAVLQRGTGEASTKVLSDADSVHPQAPHPAVDKPQRG